MLLKQALLTLTEDQDLKVLLRALDSHAIISITDEKGGILYANERFTEASGYGVEELIGKPHSIVSSGLHPPAFFEDMWRTIRSGKVWSGEICNRRKDGHLYWVESTIAPVAGKKGESVRYIAIRTEITRVKENEERLRRSQVFADIGTWDWDIVTGDLYWSERIAPLFGHREGQLATTYDNFLQAIHPDDREAVMQAVNACVSDEADYDIEHRCVWPDGTVRWLHERGDVIRDQDGVPLHMLGVVQDITARKEAELAEAQAREAAEQASRAKSQFLSAMSHELRTPLNAILGFTQLLQLDADALSDEQLDSLHEIEQAGRHLLSLINEILDLSKIEANQPDLNIEPVNLRSMIVECCKLLGPLAHPKNLNIICPIVDPELWVLADQRRLKQVILNLLSNAVKYNKPHGDIAMKHQPPADGMVRIEIVDSGIGIAAKDMDSLFKPFSRLAEDRVDEEGTGIGLSICQRLIEAMGGRIGAESEYGEGSCFWIELPLQKADTAAPEITHTEQRAALSDNGCAAKRILYVEDNAANLRLIEQIMSKVPHIDLLSATTAELAVELAEAHEPHLLLLDMQLPQCSGIELLQQLRKQAALAKVPAIALSADATETTRQAALQNSFDHYLTKPVQIDQLLKLLHTLLCGENAVRGKETGDDTHGEGERE